MNNLTIAIPVWNGEKTIGNALEALLLQIKKDSLDVKIIISDNNSTDNTKEVCSFFQARKPKIISYTRNESNIGYDANVNQLVEISKTEYIWFHSDNEIVCDSLAIVKILNYLKRDNPNFLFLNHENSIQLENISSRYYDGESFFTNIKFKSGLITNCVVNKGIWRNLSIKNYIGCQWIHFAYQIEALSPLHVAEKNVGMKVLATFISYILFSSQPSEPKWGEKGSYLYTGISLLNIFAKMEQLGYSKKLKKKADKIIIGGYPNTIFLARKDGLEINDELIQEMKNILSGYLLFWLVYLPSLKIPLIIYSIFTASMSLFNSFFRKVMYILKLPFKIIKRIIKKILRHKGYSLNKITMNKMDDEREFCTISHESYGKIYIPHYNKYAKILPEQPKIYNQDGLEMDLFFIRDRHGAHCPYADSSKYFIWDRYNIGLETHFYSHEAMLETMGKPKERYGLLVESPDIVPNDYLIFEKNKGLEKDFTGIFTYDEKILENVNNAKFYPSCATIWYGKNSTIWYGERQDAKIKMHDKTFELKGKNISMVCSDKTYTEFHKIRHMFAEEAQRLGVEVFGKFNSGTYLNDKSESLEKYRYQIAIENGISPFYFTEKIMDCFASMTIPIYLGASKIDNFFNMDGVITIKKEDIYSLDKILKQCSEKEYMDRLPAIIDNYQRSLKYLNINDYLYENYFL